MELIYTNDLCTGCNKCVRGCPVLTANIATQEGYVTVDPDKCIACGECFDVCPHEARDYYDDTDRFFEDLASGKKISVILAPAFLANYPKEYQRVLLGGLTCDSEDFYNSESHINAIFLPKLEPGNPQYIGFFHTGAYQESIGGFGGIQHCLIPAPKHIIIDRDKGDNEYYTRLFAKEQSYRAMMRILGY